MGKEYLYKVGQYVNVTLKIVEQIRINNGKWTQKGYIVQSVVYPTAKPYEKRESHLKRGDGCSYKAGQRVCPENSLYSVESIRGNIIDIDEAKTIAPHYAKEKILFQCEYEDCSHTKKMRPSDLLNRGFGCNICSKGTSYPELWFMSYDNTKNAGFLPQQTFDDFKGHIFDFVDYKNKIIVETHGEQHYEEGRGFMNHKRTVASDKRKRKYCKENNWTLIELDCRESDFEFIRNNINNEPLLEDITDNDVKGMLEIMELNKRYPVKEIIKMYTVDKLSTYKIGDKLGLTADVVTGVLKRNNVELRDASNFKKKVRCVETGVMYESLSDAKLKTGIAKTSISDVCNPDKPTRKTAGGYHWEFVD